MKIIRYMVFGVALLALAACKGKDIHLDRITLDPPVLLLTTGQDATLGVNFLSGTSEAVIWYSSAPEIATVTDGKVTCLSHGKATISAVTEKTGLRADCEVTVRTPEEMVSGVTVSPSELSLYLGEWAELTASVQPSTATEQDVVWSSSDLTIATVGSSGYVLSRAEGTAIITATTVEGGYTATCTVTVLPAFVEVESVSIADELYIKVGESVRLTPEILPENATIKDVEWKSYDESIVTVDSDGVVTGIAPGYMYVEVQTVNGGKKHKCFVAVTE